MSDGELDIKFYGDAAHVIKEQAKLIKQQEQAFEAYKKLTAESKKAGKEAEKAAKDAEKANAAAAKELEKFAKATKDINRTPLEKYADQMLQLNRALKSGRIDQETFNRAVAGARSEYAKAADAGENAFGASMAAKIGVLTAASAGLKLVWEGIQSTYKAANAEINQLGEQWSTEAPSLGSLAQLSELSPADRDRLVGEAKKTYAEGGSKTLTEAVEMQKVLESGGLGVWRPDLSRMQASGLADARVMAEGAIKLQAALGSAETGDFRQIVSKAFGGAKLGLGEPHQLLAAAAGAGQQAKRVGITDEELIAAVSSASAVVGPEEARTQINALLKGIEVEGFGGGFLKPGKSLQQYVDQLRTLEAGGSDIREMLGGRQEGIAAYGLLSSQEGKTAMAANLANIVQSDREDWFGARVALAENIPENKAAILKRSRKNREVLSAQQVATTEMVADSLESDLVADLRNRGRGEFKVQMARTMFDAQRGRQFWGGTLGGSDETFINRYSQFASDDTRQLIESLNRAGENMRDASEGLRSSASQTNHTNAARANQAAAGGAVEAR